MQLVHFLMNHATLSTLEVHLSRCVALLQLIRVMTIPYGKDDSHQKSLKWYGLLRLYVECV